MSEYPLIHIDCMQLGRQHPILLLSTVHLWDLLLEPVSHMLQHLSE